MNDKQLYLLKFLPVITLAGFFSLLAWLTLMPLAAVAQSPSCYWNGEPPLPPTGTGIFTVTGIISGQNNQPTECTQVFAFSGSGRFFTYTDKDGKFTLVLAAGTYEFVINPKPGSGLASQGIRGINTPRFLAIKLPAGSTISGTIYDPSGNVVTDDVAIFAFSKENFSGFGLPGARNGVYQISLAKGLWELTFTPPNHKGLAPTLVVLTLTQNISQNIFLNPGFTLYGQVLTPGGNGGQPNVKIFAHSPADNSGFGFSPTDEAGSFKGSLPAGKSFDISLLAPPFLGLGSTVISNVTRSAGDDLRIDPRLPAGYTISGTIICRFGQPNFFVNADPIDVFDSLLSGWGDFANAEGFYALALQPGTYKFEVSAPGNSSFRPLEPRAVMVNRNMTLNFDYPCVEGTTYAKVVDEEGEPLTKATIIHNGKRVTDTLNGSLITDINGNLVLTRTKVGDTLVALAPLHTQDTVRAVHEGWAYRVYKTNLPVSNDGVIQPFRMITTTGPQTLTVHSNNVLVLYNLVVSIEWDASKEYLDIIKDALTKASAYLYDVTDGQMAFEQVTIYDNGGHWADADIQISTKNTVRPYAFLGGIVSENKSHTIRVGRFWNGDSGNQGNWNEPDGYRTLIHEFGHYALHLQDEYLLRTFDTNGNLIGEVSAACTNQDKVGPPATPERDKPENASIMYYQYNTSELSDESFNWSEDCLDTEQQRLNHKSDWQTIREHYGNPTWIIKTPSSRGKIVTGPIFPTSLLPFPKITTHNSGPGGEPFKVIVKNPQQQLVPNALVALYVETPLGKMAVDQGLTNSSGEIYVYGAAPGNHVRAATFDGALYGTVEVSNQLTHEISLIPTYLGDLSIQATRTSPYLNLHPSTEGDTLTLQIHGASKGGILMGTVFSGVREGAANSTPLTYSPTEAAYTGAVNFTTVGLGSGSIRVVGVSGNQVISLHSNYNLQQVRPFTNNHLYSEDGNFELHIPPGGLPANGYSTVLPTGYVPGPLPAGKQVIGSAYEVRISGALVKLEKDGLVRLHYHPEVTGNYTNTAIYYWDPGQKKWQPLGGTQSEIDKALSVKARLLGIYALMGVPVMDVTVRVYLPLIVK